MTSNQQQRSMLTDNTLILSSQGKAGSTHPHHLLDEVATVEVEAESDAEGQGRVSIGGETGGDQGPGSAVVAVLAVHRTTENGISPPLKTLLR